MPPEKGLTHRATFAKIVGFAHKGGVSAQQEAPQMVCSVDDGPKTDWLILGP